MLFTKNNIRRSKKKEKSYSKLTQIQCHNCNHINNVDLPQKDEETGSYPDIHCSSCGTLLA